MPWLIYKNYKKHLKVHHLIICLNNLFLLLVDLTPGSGSPAAVLSFTPCYFCLGYTIKFDGKEIMLLREKKVIGSKTLDSPTLNTNMYFMTKYHRNGVLKLKVGIPKSGRLGSKVRGVDKGGHI